MATFLSMTNEVLRRINEVPVAESDFSTTRNIQGLAKDAVNNAIRHILQSAQQWPFTVVVYEQVLTAGTREYDFPADLSVLDYESFYTKPSTSLNTSGGALGQMDHDQYQRYYRSADDQREAGDYAEPTHVYKTQQNKFGLMPTPDKAYTVEYKYWSFPSDLSNASDTPVIPDRFKHIIIEGAMVFLMRFRSNEQAAAMHEKKFEEGINMMRRLLQQPVSQVTSTVVNKNTSYIVNV